MEIVVFAIGLGSGFALLISGAKVRVLDGPPIESGASVGSARTAFGLIAADRQNAGAHGRREREPVGADPRPGPSRPLPLRTGLCRRLLGRPASGSGTLWHGDGAQARGARRRRAFMLPILCAVGS